MTVIRKWEDFPYFSEGALTIGFFDGFHMGHRKIIRRLGQLSRQSLGKTVVFTFPNHPLSVLVPEKAPALISPPSFKEEFLEAQGVDYLFIPEFTKELSRIRPLRFLEMLQSRFGVLKLIVGSDFHFGSGNEGNVQSIRQYARNHGNFSLEVIDPVLWNRQRVSSSLIREKIRRGEMEKVLLLLQREFFVEKQVIQGNRKGQKIGFPTVNLPVPEGQIIPRLGVYTGRVQTDRGNFPALIYVGKQKLREKLENPLIEAHLVGFRGSLYGDTVRVCFSRWVREPRKMEGLEELKRQLEEDKKYLTFNLRNSYI